MTVSTPCVDICRIDPASRLCTGCLRSIDEITRWAGMTETERLEIMADLPARTTLPAAMRPAD